MTDRYATNPAALSDLDRAWRSFHHGSTGHDAAMHAMVDAGVLRAEARNLLASPDLPSLGILAYAGRAGE